MKILVLESVSVATKIKKGLEAAGLGYQITICNNGTEGEALAKSGEFNFLVLDRELPKKDGFAILSDLQQNAAGMMPVLMLAAKAETDDIVSGLDAGADFFMAKPFESAELQARVGALIRRNKLARGAYIYFADVKIDPVNHRVWRSGTEISLTQVEYKIFAHFVKNHGVALSRQDIFDKCWDEPAVDLFSNIIDVYINYLRKKIDAPYATKLIHTSRGKGYVLEEKLGVPGKNSI
jgi:DNA-binding response OmpR family regulator